MDFLTYCKKVETKTGVCPILHKVDHDLCDSYARSMVILFREIVAQEHKNPAQFQALKAAYGAVAQGAMKYLDKAGVTAAVAQVAPMLLQVSFVESARVLAYESSFIHSMGVPYDKIRPYWSFVDRNKAAVIRRMVEPGFTLESIVSPAVAAFGTEQGGADWEHLSPGFWRRMVGLGLVVTNLVATLPTCGVAAASVVVGTVGVAAG